MTVTEYKADLQGCNVQFHGHKKVRPFPPPSIPYHLKERAEKPLQEKMDQDAIEEYPSGELAPWVSDRVLAPKEDDSIRMTLDACHVNEAILQTYPKAERC